MSLIENFIDAMRQAGLAPANPSDIRSDNKRHDYQLEGDKRGHKKGYYKLKIDGDFGFGFFGDYRQSEFEKWVSAAPRTYSDAERREFAKRMERERQAQEIEQEALWQAKAAEAVDTLLFTSPCPPEHAYLQKKGVLPYGISLSGRDIIIPMSDASGVRNIQSIKPDGTKLFFKDAKKQGAWFEIPGDTTICIVEGYATGASVYEATGHTVIIAFDAGNLVPVAAAIRAKHPENRVIICADNDAFTVRPDGKPTNPGIIKGTQAAIAINADLIYPEFTDTATKPTDFNDLHQLEGLDVVRDTIHAAKKPDGKAAGGAIASPRDVGSQAPGSDLIDWEGQLQKNKNGELIPRSVSNLLLVMRHHDDLKNIFRYDSFAKRIIVHRPPPWEDAQTFLVRSVCDYDYFRLEAFLEQNYGLKVTKEKCADAIASTAQLPENTFNPASDYFSVLEWDGIPRIDTWLREYASDGSQPDCYLKIVGRKFMCGLAARAIYPGIKFDTMIILEGKQYAGKSFLSKILSTINGAEYFLDDFKDIENKDSLMKMQGKLVIEFPEISAMRKAEINDLKAFLSRTHDVFRPPYGRNTLESGRQCVFVGTINPEGPYLRDVTGNRRYWPISCRDVLNLEDLRRVIPLLHAEAAHLVRNGEQLWLTKEEYDIAVTEQNKRVLNDVWADKITDIVQGKNEISTDEILQEMGIPRDKQTPQVQSRVTQTMVSIDWVPCRLSVGTKRPRGFRRMSAIEAIQENLTADEGEIITW